VDSQRTDIPARKLEWLNGKSIGGNHPLPLLHRQGNRIGVGIEQWVGQFSRK
jgi:hypothetical protein